MYKFISALLVVLALAGCGEKDATTSSNGQTTKTETVSNEKASSDTLTTKQVIDKFKEAKLEFTSSPMKADQRGALAPKLDIEAIRIAIPNPEYEEEKRRDENLGLTGEDAMARKEIAGGVFLFDNQENLETTKTYYGTVGMFTYSVKNILFVIGDEIKDEGFKKYKQAMDTLK